MNNSSKNRIYSKNEDLKILWQPEVCIHSTKCFQALPNVFNPNQRPWVNLEKAEADEIIKTVKNCPSGALSLLNEKEQNNSDAVKITVLKDGPVLIKGRIEIDFAGNSETIENKQIALCRCGASNNKPYCDGSHIKVGFKAD
ncbi:(4Fe-4S)-binding protein [Flammeovirga pacifica]|uniref:Iron-binding zinc finger CDGSH type domain-containing protein n=1 Tax=Flammeovirga pacifica TaxID=915059 RepID=A0A1S1Z4C0_FLAPC|nr:(4Fe-4S)-binding protein [Flammeovirga pacifica]OHX67925.1 hypothetical protein NH26_17050 [Flammeovirga pacifica]